MRKLQPKPIQPKSINLSDADVNYVPPEKTSKGGSFIWNYFEKIDKLKARCKSCTVILQTPTGSTSALIRHFLSKHSAVTKSAKFEREEKRRVVTPLDPTSQKATEMSRGLAFMTAKDLQPYSVVDDVCFRYFLNAAEQRYQIPSRTVMSRKIIPEMYETELEKSKLKLQNDLKGNTLILLAIFHENKIQSFLFEKAKTAANSLARSFLKLNLLNPLINF